MRRLFLAGALLLLLAGGSFYLFFWEMPAKVSPSADNHSVTLAPEAEEVLEKNIDSVRESLGTDLVIIEALKREGLLHNALALTQIEALDRRWRGASDEDPLIKGLLESEVSGRLLSFQ